MSLFIIQKEPVAQPEKTSETAMAIYEKLKEFKGDISAVFSSGAGYPVSWIKWVHKDAKRLEKELLAIVRDNKIITVTQAAKLLNSSYLTITTVGLDIIHYNPTYDEDRTFNQFKAIYYVAPPVIEE